MSRKKYTAWHLNRARAAYLRTGSIAEATAAAKGPSPTWVYNHLKAEGLIDDWPSYGSRTRREITERAVELYTDPERPLSLREVEERLSVEFDQVPSNQWIYEQLRDRGVIRNKSEANRARAMKETGLNYEELESAVALLYVERKLSTHRIAQHLKLSRATVSRWLKDAGLIRSVREGMIASMYEATTAEARERRNESVAVARMRYEDLMTNTAIAEATGYSMTKRQSRVEVENGLASRCVVRRVELTTPLAPATPPTR